MARQLTLAYPGDLNTLTGGYIYNKRILAELETLGWHTHKLALDARFPAVDEAVKRASAEQLAQVAPDQVLVIDGLVLGALGHHTKAITQARAFVALVHHPLALESGVDAATAQTLRETERVALSLAQSVIVTSQTTEQTLIDQYDVAANKITVIEPGVDRPGQSLTSGTLNTTDTSPTTKPVRLLSVGALVPRKGFDVLVTALGQLAELNWRLTIVGDETRAPAYTEQVKGSIQQLKLESKVTFAGAVLAEELAKHYSKADLFVLASRYEGYGMAYSEALAWGLPVIGTDGGAAVQTLATPAAIIVAVDDVAKLTRALRALIADSETREQMRLAAIEHAKRLPSWQDAGRKFAQVLTVDSQ